MKKTRRLTTHLILGNCGVGCSPPIFKEAKSKPDECLNRGFRIFTSELMLKDGLHEVVGMAPREPPGRNKLGDLGGHPVRVPQWATRGHTTSVVQTSA